jgi:hypothetical protein
MRFLAPELTKAMPAVAEMLLWLIVLAFVILILAHIAAFGFIRSRDRFTIEESKAPGETRSVTVVLDLHRYLRQAKHASRIFGTVMIVIFVVFLITAPLPQYVFELFALVVAGLWGPMHIAFTILAKAFEMEAEHTRGPASL